MDISCIVKSLKPFNEMDEKIKKSVQNNLESIEISVNVFLTIFA